MGYSHDPPCPLGYRTAKYPSFCKFSCKREIWRLQEEFFFVGHCCGGCWEEQVGRCGTDHQKESKWKSGMLLHGGGGFNITTPPMVSQTGIKYTASWNKFWDRVEKNIWKVDKRHYNINFLLGVCSRKMMIYSARWVQILPTNRLLVNNITR